MPRRCGAVTIWLAQRYASAVIYCQGCFLLRHLDSPGRPLVLLEENVESAIGRDRAHFANPNPS